MDIEKLLKSLNENNVRYLIIGATAFPVHGYSRATLDIDIFIDPSLDNAKKVHKALSEFGYDVSDVSIDDLIKNKILIRQYLIETDVHPFVAGINFEEAWRGRIESEIGNTKVFFAGLDDLIKMKKAAGRPKDNEDLKFLEEIKNRQIKEGK
ncbi:MAG TPA: hypothetical protein ENH19_02845 [Actinobacteria bacterium]|nr:hypothetical protein [Actinomycetes bacterium]HEX21573.1 hypothetical protein [Actinomycetota bacterium]